jgi:hypothetical protein
MRTKVNIEIPSKINGIVSSRRMMYLPMQPPAQQPRQKPGFAGVLI